MNIQIQGIRESRQKQQFSPRYSKISKTIQSLPRESKETYASMFKGQASNLELRNSQSISNNSRIAENATARNEVENKIINKQTRDEHINIYDQSMT